METQGHTLKDDLKIVFSKIQRRCWAQRKFPWGLFTKNTGPCFKAKADV